MLPYNQRGMLEILVIFFILIFVIAYLFYKHRRSDLEILQLENEQIPEQLSELLEELQPVVIRGVNPPKGLTRSSPLASNWQKSFPLVSGPIMFGSPSFRKALG